MLEVGVFEIFRATRLREVLNRALLELLMRDLGLSFVRVASGQAEGGVGVAIRLGLMRNVEVVVEDCL